MLLASTCDWSTAPVWGGALLFRARLRNTQQCRIYLFMYIYIYILRTDISNARVRKNTIVSFLVPLSVNTMPEGQRTALSEHRSEWPAFELRASPAGDSKKLVLDVYIYMKI